MESLKFIERGTGGKVLVCLHGFLGEAVDWLPFANDFLAKVPGWRVVMVDLPGHGHEEPGWRCPDADWVSRALRDLVESRGWGTPVLVGYSLGGRLGLRAALSFPDCFPVFVGLSTSAGIEDVNERRSRAISDSVLAKRLASNVDFPNFLREWWNQPVFASPARRDEEFKKFFSSRMRRHPIRMAECLETWSTGRLSSLWPLLCRYPGRALLVSGEADVKYGLLAKRMASAFARATRVQINGAGHQLLLEKPEETALAVSSFIASVN